MDRVRLIRHRLTVGHHDHRVGKLALEGTQQSDDLLPVLGIQISRGLIGQDQLGSMHQRPPDGGALLLPSGQFSGPVVRPMTEADRLQNGSDPLLHRLPSFPSQQQGEADVFSHRQPRNEMEGLKHHPDTVPAEGGPVRV